MPCVEGADRDDTVPVRGSMMFPVGSGLRKNPSLRSTYPSMTPVPRSWSCRSGSSPLSRQGRTQGESDMRGAIRNVGVHPVRTTVTSPGDASDLPKDRDAVPREVDGTVYSSYPPFFAGSGSLVARTPDVHLGKGRRRSVERRCSEASWSRRIADDRPKCSPRSCCSPRRRRQPPLPDAPVARH